ncbi:MAG: hypothetical protein MUO34_09845 [Ignavibacteriaceae bacterium]|nr:hypothetical protein [Ignavibacteriaceae bacterium]
MNAFFNMLCLNVFALIKLSSIAFSSAPDPVQTSQLAKAVYQCSVLLVVQESAINSL